MPFSEKINLLMNTLSISNSRLAKALSLDSSLISRWRTGKRTPTKNSDYIKAIASYFAAQAKMNYQKIALFEIMGLAFGNKIDDIPSISDLLYTWLCSDTASIQAKLVDGFLDKLDIFGSSKTRLSKMDINNPFPTGQQLNVEVFHGACGKQEGVIRFLSVVAAQSKPCTLLLYSDEGMEWLNEDKAFSAKWISVLIDILSKGHRIKIIHTINRDLSEMLSAIDRWLPLYMTGAIEPYYYPKYCKHIFRRTLFIAPDIAALTSTTLSEQSINSDQFFYIDRKIISGLVDEFNAYLGMCRPLMQIYTASNIHKFSDLLVEFEDQPGDYTSFSSTLSSVTMKESTFCRLLERTGIDGNVKEKLIEIQKARYKAFESNIKHSKYTEIIALPPPAEISPDAALFKVKGVLSGVALCYSASDCREHLENIIRLLEIHENYNFIIQTQELSQNVRLSVKDEIGVIVAKNDADPILFAFNQQNMTAAFNIYMENMLSRIPKKERSKKHAISMLSGIISKV